MAVMLELKASTTGETVCTESRRGLILCLNYSTGARDRCRNYLMNSHVRNEWGPLPSGSQLMVSEEDGSHTGEVELCWGLVEQAR